MTPENTFIRQRAGRAPSRVCRECRRARERK